MRNHVIGLCALLLAALIPATAGARPTTWEVSPGGAFSGDGTITVWDTTCSLRFEGTFFNSAGEGQISKADISGCSGPSPSLFPTIRTPIDMTATTYLESIDTTSGPLRGVILDVADPECPVTFAGPGGPDDPNSPLEALHGNETSEMWWSSGIGFTFTVHDPNHCYDDREAPGALWKFSINPAQTIRPA